MPEIHKLLMLSTAHLPEEVMRNIEEYASVAYPNDYGAFVYVSDHRVKGSEALEAVMEYARRHDCVYIKFDNAVPINPDLRIWDW
jgi:hypothetical protein